LLAQIAEQRSKLITSAHNADIMMVKRFLPPKKAKASEEKAAEKPGKAKSK